jgi:hypothetical protein
MYSDYYFTPSVPWYKVYSFLWKNLEYKVYDGIVRFFLHNLRVNLIRRDKIMIFPFFSSILTLTSYLYYRLKLSKFTLLACALIFMQENYTAYIKEWREYQTAHE